MAACEKAKADKETEPSTAKETLDQTQTSLENANSEKTAADQAKVDADKELEAAKSLKANADQLQANAESNLAKAQDAAKTSREQIAKGSLGYFEQNGSDAALHVFEDTAYNKYTKVGEAKDATSLENIKASLEYIQKCNELRKENGLAELIIDDKTMAIAQYCANASAYTMDHTRILGNLKTGNVLWETLYVKRRINSKHPRLY